MLAKLLVVRVMDGIIHRVLFRSRIPVNNRNARFLCLFERRSEACRIVWRHADCVYALRDVVFHHFELLRCVRFRRPCVNHFKAHILSTLLRALFSRVEVRDTNELGHDNYLHLGAVCFCAAVRRSSRAAIV